MHIPDIQKLKPTDSQSVLSVVRTQTLPQRANNCHILLCTAMPTCTYLTGRVGPSVMSSKAAETAARSQWISELYLQFSPYILSSLRNCNHSKIKMT